MKQDTSNNQQNQLLERFLPFLFDILIQSDPNAYIIIGLGKDLEIFVEDINIHISLDTVGFIGKTLNGKEYMLANPKFGNFIEKLIQMIRSAQSDIR